MTNKNKAELFRLFQQDMLNFLIENDGKNLRQMIRYAEKSKSRKVKRDLEAILSHPAIKPLVPD